MEEPDKEIKTENAAMEVLSVSRNGNDIKIKCRFTFDRDISSLAEECEAYDKPQGNVLNAPPFKECTVLMNGQDLKADLHPDEKETVQGSLSCRNTEINGKTLVQTINILDFTPETTDDTISLRYRDIVIDGEKIAGEWNYEHTLNSDAYPDKELEKREIGITVVDSFGDTYTMDSFAVTPNGIKIFGTVQEKEKNVTEDVYPSQGKLIRIIAKDDLGNEYLLYPKYPSGGNEAVYELYTGPADVEDAYPDEWDPKATKVTIALQQEVLTWLSKTEIESEYPVISEEFTIKLSE